MRTKQATGRRWTGGQARWASTAVAALTVAAATGVGVTNAAATAVPTEQNTMSEAFSVPARATFDYTGEFANVTTAPQGTPTIGGKAAMVVTTKATTTSLAVTGLDPNTVYVADVHDKACFLGSGERFLFDPAGPKAPAERDLAVADQGQPDRSGHRDEHQREAGRAAREVHRAPSPAGCRG